MEGTEIVEANAWKRAWEDEGKLDEYCSRVCTQMTTGDLFRMREFATNARSMFIANAGFNAIFERDISLLAAIVKRIDGTIPTEGDRYMYANMFGEAIEQVLGLEKKEQLHLSPDEPVIVSLAKVVVQTSMLPAGRNQTLRKERLLATEMVFERTQGRKVDPKRLPDQVAYIEPEWMSDLDEEDEDAEAR